MERRLTAILAADVVGYSRLMEVDEASTHAALRAHLTQLIEPKVVQHGGRTIKLMGDGALMEFPSVVDAVAYAVDVQLAMAARNAAVSEDRQIRFRIGVHLGDVMVEGDDLYGDGVNVAARLEGLADADGICISQQVFDQIETKLDLSYEDMGDQQVKNIARPVRAFRVALDDKAEVLASSLEATVPQTARRRWPLWTAAVVALAVIVGATGWYVSIVTRADPVLTLPSGPSIAVVPFANLSGNPDDAYFNVGLTEDIINALSRFSNLLVFARESTSQFTGESIDPQAVGRKLGARYVLSGSVRRSQDKLRIITKLLDAKDGTQLWSETYDRDLTAADVFAVQDEITERVVGLVGSSDAPLFKSEIKEALRTERPDNLEAYECVLLSIWVYDDFLPEAHARARDCLEHAVALDPDYALAWAHLGQMYFEEHKYGYNRRPEPIERARAAVQTALELNPQNQYAHYMLALIQYVQESSFEPFYAAAERAIALNPNNAFVLADLGTWMAYSGLWDRGKALVAKAIRLNPFHQRWLHVSFFLDHYRKGEYREALDVVLKINLPNNEGIQTGLAAVYGRLGETERAKAIVDHLLAIRPGYADDPRGWFVRRRMPDDLVESLMDGLRDVGFAVPPLS